MRKDLRYLTAKQAADALGVTLATLYAYTSRGQLQSEPAPGRTREHRYYREDVERLRERKEARRNPARAAERGLHWGSPVLSSSITLVQNGRLYYRGRDALELAETSTLEQVAELLWATDESERERLFDQRCPVPVRLLAWLRGAATDPLVRFQAALPLAGGLDLASHDLRPASVRHAGTKIVRLLTTILAGRDSTAPVHLAIENAWARGRASTGDAIRKALVLCADHELNVSAFTARCAASAGASPYDAVGAAMAALRGHRHGGETRRVAALFDEIGAPRRARTVIANRLRRGERLPGFGHPLYPAGDPRGELLMRLAEQSGNRAEWPLIRALASAGRELLDEQPNLDFGLVALARACQLPSDAPIILFALGRTVGWIAHMIEQHSSGELIRPRARYTGRAPNSA